MTWYPLDGSVGWTVYPAEGTLYRKRLRTDWQFRMDRGEVAALSADAQRRDMTLDQYARWIVSMKHEEAAACYARWNNPKLQSAAISLRTTGCVIQFLMPRPDRRGEPWWMGDEPT